ncbi:hypothetical protein [Mitsuokella sp.]|uniref:hypothetical protein n=1 Tax=Mitsuokella sp. TaxID=2049034 RepID=UPI003D7C9C40
MPNDEAIISVQSEKIIHVSLFKGDGTPENPERTVDRYYTEDGVQICDTDKMFNSARFVADANIIRRAADCLRPHVKNPDLEEFKKAAEMLKALNL